MIIDIKKMYRTRDGREAVIYSLNGRNSQQPVIGAIRINRGGEGWTTQEWSTDGRWSFESGLAHEYDLVEYKGPVITKRYLPVKNLYGSSYDSLEAAKFFDCPILELTYADSDFKSVRKVKHGS